MILITAPSPWGFWLSFGMAIGFIILSAIQTERIFKLKTELNDSHHKTDWLLTHHIKTEDGYYTFPDGERWVCGSLTRFNARLQTERIWPSQGIPLPPSPIAIAQGDRL